MLKTRDFLKLKESLRGHSAEIFPDPADLLADNEKRVQQIDIKIQEDQDQNIQKQIQWLQTGKIEDLGYANSKLKKYYKQLDRLLIDNDILYRNFFAMMEQLKISFSVYHKVIEKN